jgi:uncharacterized protein YndB with AHSA1/START domain
MQTEKSITITRIFDAPKEEVWAAWTNPEIVKKWWGPEGFTCPSIKIDFTVGGRYVYCMRGQEGSQWDRDMYTAGVFKEIIPYEKIVITDYFSDFEGNKIEPSQEDMDANFPTEMTCIINFEAIDDEKTKITLEYPETLNESQFEAMKNSGMEEGWQSSFNKLSEIVNEA